MYEFVTNGVWMTWNLFLALIPLALAVYLFSARRDGRGPAWWIIFVGFVAFLPNAPYVITDLKHFQGDMQRLQGKTLASIAVVGEYALLVLVGVAAYAGSLELLRRYVRGHGWSRTKALALEFGLHGLSAVGVLLGRYARFNSWELGTRPGDVFEHAASRVDRPASWLLLISTFAVIVTATGVMRVLGSTAATALRRVRGDL